MISLEDKILHRQNVAVVDAADPTTSLAIISNRDVAEDSTTVTVNKWLKLPADCDEFEVLVEIESGGVLDAKYVTLVPCFLNNWDQILANRYVTYGDQSQFGGLQATQKRFNGAHEKPCFMRIVDISAATTVTKIELRPIYTA